MRRFLCHRNITWRQSSDHAFIDAITPHHDRLIDHACLILITTDRLVVVSMPCQPIRQHCGAIRSRVAPKLIISSNAL